jgi:general secretion pathway protein J
MAIFTIIGLASTGVLTTVIDSDKASSERFEKLQLLQRSMLTIERDILQAVARPIRIDGQPNENVIQGGKDAFESQADGLGFVHAGWQNPNLMLPRSTLQAVAYRLQEEELIRVYGNYVDNVIGFEPKERVLLTGIEDFRVDFFAGNAGDDLDDEENWQEDYRSKTLPLALAINIVSKDFGEIRRQFVLSEGSASIDSSTFSPQNSNTPKRGTSAPAGGEDNRVNKDDN